LNKLQCACSLVQKSKPLVKQKEKKKVGLVVVVVVVGVVVVTEGIKLGPIRAAVLNCEWEVLLIHL